jgi:hypothetical protein
MEITYEASPRHVLDADALWFWGRLRDFERNGILDRDRESYCGCFGSVAL